MTAHKNPIEKTVKVWYHMMLVNAKNLHYRALNEALRKAAHDCAVTDCCGQCYIAAGMSDKSITISGVPGNALGAYLNGTVITVNANAQEAVGDTMNAGIIVVHGNIRDARRENVPAF